MGRRHSLNIQRVSILRDIGEMYQMENEMVWEYYISLMDAFIMAYGRIICPMA